jgi:membrane protein DedA with SNARE-associated domain
MAARRWSRFFAVLRQLNGIVAGSVGMAWGRFLTYNAVGAALWVSAWGFGVYYFRQALGQVIARVHGLGYVIGLLALIVVIGCIALYARDRAPG